MNGAGMVNIRSEIWQWYMNDWITAIDQYSFENKISYNNKYLFKKVLAWCKINGAALWENVCSKSTMKI